MAYAVLPCRTKSVQTVHFRSNGGLGGFFLTMLLDLGFGSGCSETGPWHAGRPEDELAPPLGATAGALVGLALAFAFALPTATEYSPSRRWVSLHVQE